MPRLDIKRKVLLGIGLVIVIQVIWFVVVQKKVNDTQYKTTATVIRMVNAGNTCSSARLCDSSDSQYPVYEYYDLHGKRYEQDDRFFGDFKKGNPLRVIFGKDVGDKVTAYYTKDKPQEVLFMASIWSYAAWFAPFFLVVTVAVFGAFIFLFLRAKSALKY